ncbi:D-aminoacyl-tRNA deacylase [Clostridia bacterium]|nr:D-aminoacyl-tRNA deacylase [Clostridia bacterium]
MRVVLQRIVDGTVVVKNDLVAQISNGLLVYLGVGHEDTEKDAEYLVNKIVKLRIFEDKSEKLNLSLQDISGEILVVSQFTLYADCGKRNRPNFLKAAPPDIAKKLYEYFIAKCKEKQIKTASGIFGAYMNIKSTNFGPLTIIIDTKESLSQK